MRMPVKKLAVRFQYGFSRPGMEVHRLYHPFSFQRRQLQLGVQYQKRRHTVCADCAVAEIAADGRDAADLGAST